MASCDQALDINSVHRFGLLASLNTLRVLHNDLEDCPRSLTPSRLLHFFTPL
jgi:hypothetical protein